MTMTSKVTGTRKVWRGEFGYILADDGNDVFLHYRECERCGIQFPMQATNWNSRSSADRKVFARFVLPMSDRERETHLTPKGIPI